MTISLRIGKGAKAKRAPVATHEEFKREWQPGCAALALEQIPLMMDAGLSVAPSEGADVLAELYQLRGWMIAKGTAASTVTRVDQVIAAIRGQGADEVYVG